MTSIDFMNVKLLGVQVGVVGEQGPGDTGEEGRDHEREHLVAGRRDAEGFGRDLIFANREERPAVVGTHEVSDDHEGHDHAAEHPGKIGAGRHAGKAAGPPDGVDVQDHDPDDLAEAEGHDRQVVAAEPHRGKTHQESAAALTAPPTRIASKNGPAAARPPSPVSTPNSRGTA